MAHIPRYIQPILILAGLLLLPACSHTSPRRSNPPEVSQHQRPIKSHLLQTVQRWSGTPYEWGGTNRSGIDCSAFVQQIYRTVFATQLPRHTRNQMQTGHRIDPAQLAIGDLVFFRTSGRTLHVGVYIEANRFAHASLSEGVTISNLKQSYWTQRFLMARRISTAETPRTDSRHRTQRANDRRSAW